MADATKIEWTDATWNPVTGCSVVSPGCTHCYAMKLAGTRLAHHPSRAGLTRDTKAGPVWNGTLRFNEEWLTQPLHWKRPRMVFVCAHGDLFHEDLPDEWLDKIFAVMDQAKHHRFQVLTKRSQRMRDYIRFRYELPPHIMAFYDDEAGAEPKRGWQPPKNVWLGVSAEDQERWDQRVKDLRETPAAVRFVSAEPLLGPINDDMHKLHWVIVGGESGRGARPMHPDWARQIQDACAAAGTAFFFKQWGEWQPRRWKADGGTHAMRVTAPDWGCFQQIQSHPNSIERVEPAPEGWQAFAAVGKKAAGRLLDGVEHNAMPRAA